MRRCAGELDVGGVCGVWAFGESTPTNLQKGATILIEILSFHVRIFVCFALVFFTKISRFHEVCTQSITTYMCLYHHLPPMSHDSPRPVSNDPTPVHYASASSVRTHNMCALPQKPGNNHAARPFAVPSASRDLNSLDIGLFRQLTPRSFCQMGVGGAIENHTRTHKHTHAKA